MFSSGDASLYASVMGLIFSSRRFGGVENPPAGVIIMDKIARIKIDEHIARRKAWRSSQVWDRADA